MKIKILLIFCLSAFYGNAQEKIIKLQNASFEGEPQDATTPVGWHPCEIGATPDILPGIWGVTNETSDGETYVGLITRPNGTFEGIGQRLTESLEPGECYSFSIDVAHSKTYTGYDKSIKLRVWGGTTKCEKDLLIGKTDFIDGEEWETADFKIYPKAGAPINYLIFEAYYTDEEFSRKGNILLDNISVIKKCNRASNDVEVKSIEIPRS